MGWRTAAGSLDDSHPKPMAIIERGEQERRKEQDAGGERERRAAAYVKPFRGASEGWRRMECEARNEGESREEEASGIIRCWLSHMISRHMRSTRP